MDVVISVVNYVYTSFLRLGGSRVYGDGNSGALVLERELPTIEWPFLNNAAFQSSLTNLIFKMLSRKWD